MHVLSLNLQRGGGINASAYGALFGLLVVGGTSGTFERARDTDYGLRSRRQALPKVEIEDSGLKEESVVWI